MKYKYYLVHRTWILCSDNTQTHILHTTQWWWYTNVVKCQYIILTNISDKNLICLLLSSNFLWLWNGAMFSPIIICVHHKLHNHNENKKTVCLEDKTAGGVWWYKYHGHTATEHVDQIGVTIVNRTVNYCLHHATYRKVNHCLETFVMIYIYI